MMMIDGADGVLQNRMARRKTALSLAKSIHNHRIDVVNIRIIQYLLHVLSRAVLFIILHL